MIINDISRIKLVRHFCGTSVPARPMISHKSFGEIFLWFKWYRGKCSWDWVFRILDFGFRIHKSLNAEENFHERGSLKAATIKLLQHFTGFHLHLQDRMIFLLWKNHHFAFFLFQFFSTFKWDTSSGIVSFCKLYDSYFPQNTISQYYGHIVTVKGQRKW